MSFRAEVFRKLDRENLDAVGFSPIWEVERWMI